jgi:hypothetical protein
MHGPKHRMKKDEKLRQSTVEPRSEHLSTLLSLREGCHPCLAEYEAFIELAENYLID